MCAQEFECGVHRITGTCIEPTFEDYRHDAKARDIRKQLPHLGVRVSHPTSGVEQAEVALTGFYPVATLHSRPPPFSKMSTRTEQRQPFSVRLHPFRKAEVIAGLRYIKIPGTRSGI